MNKEKTKQREWSLFRSVGFYVLSSAVSAVIDVLIFFIIANVLFKEVSALNTLIATVGARIISSLVNFTLNFKYVFSGKGKNSLIKYYILWTAQLSASFGLVFLFGNVLGLYLVPTKIAVDLLLGAVSYSVQRLWVFSDGRDRRIGSLVIFCRFFARLFSHRYSSSVNERRGALYVARHLNMHGPYTTLKWLDFEVSPMVLGVFFDESDCYRQYNEYTFTQRQGKRPRKFNIKAYIASRIVPKLVRSYRSVPVYRDRRAVKTFKTAAERLISGDNLIIFPDIEYTVAEDRVSELYPGFLYIGQYYKRLTGKELEIVPLYIDEGSRTISEGASVSVSDYNSESEAAILHIKLAINGRHVENNQRGEDEV